MHLLESTNEEVQEYITSKKARICVVGLGKMGLPIVTVFTHSGYTVNGLDISEDLVSSLNTGNTTINEPEVPDRLKSAIENKLFHATTNVAEAVAGVDFIILIIPVLTSDDGHADISILNETYKKLIEVADDGVVFVQESTLPPGTTSGPIKDLLEAGGKQSGKNFGIVFAPERTFSGRAIQDIEENYPKIIGGDTDNAAFAAKMLYEQVCQKGVIKTSNATTAEAVKTFKGAYRDANIAIANELAVLADLYGVDILEVIEAANTEPFSHIHTPGIGVGGHCIPVYPRFLISLGKDFKYDATVLDTARTVNDSMVDYAITTLEKHIEKWDTVLILGLAYRGGVKEYRLSPTLRLVPQLRARGAMVKLMDPLYSKEELDTLFGDNIGEDWSIDSVEKYSTIVIVTAHDQYRELNTTLKNSEKKVIFDGRYVLDNLSNHKILQPGRLYLQK